MQKVGLVAFRRQPDLLERGHVSTPSGPISIWILLLSFNERLGRSTATDQLTDVGSQGGPLSQGCVANAPTAGAGMQTRPSTSRASDVVVALA
jgi:hypothetical protein